jgi:tetratricopeptide (TPR) repeat protein
MLLFYGGQGGDRPALAQQPATSSPNATTSDEEQSLCTGLQLIGASTGNLIAKGTAEQRQQALAKYEEALLSGQQLAVNEAPPYVARMVEASTLGLVLAASTTDQTSPLGEGLFRAGLGFSRDLKNRLQDAIARLKADNAGSNANDQQELLDFYNQALASSNYQEAVLLYSLGNVYLELGENQKALESYNQALTLYKAEKKPLDEATVLGSIGNLYFQSGETKKALDFYNQALEIQRTEKDTAAQAGTLSSIAGSTRNWANRKRRLPLIIKHSNSSEKGTIWRGKRVFLRVLACSTSHWVSFSWRWIPITKR